MAEIARRWAFLIIDEDGEVSGTDDETVAADMAGEFQVIKVYPDGSTSIMDEDFEPVAIKSLAN